MPPRPSRSLRSDRCRRHTSSRSRSHVSRGGTVQRLMTSSEAISAPGRATRLLVGARGARIACSRTIALSRLGTRRTCDTGALTWAWLHVPCGAEQAPRVVGCCLESPRCAWLATPEDEFHALQTASQGHLKRDGGGRTCAARVGDRKFDFRECHSAGVDHSRNDILAGARVAGNGENDESATRSDAVWKVNDALASIIKVPNGRQRIYRDFERGERRVAVRHKVAQVDQPRFACGEVESGRLGDRHIIFRLNRDGDRGSA
eukprot:5527145-Prymnesium_polylepis.7